MTVSFFFFHTVKLGQFPGGWALPAVKSTTWFYTGSAAQFVEGQISHACSAEKHGLEKALGQRGCGRGVSSSRGPPQWAHQWRASCERRRQSWTHLGFKPHISLIQVALFTLLPHKVKKMLCVPNSYHVPKTIGKEPGTGLDMEYLLTNENSCCRPHCFALDAFTISIW